MSASFFITGHEAKSENLTIFKPSIPKQRNLCADLPLLERATFILYLSGFSVREIGTLLGVGIGSVSRYVSKGLKKYPEAKRV